MYEEIDLLEQIESNFDELLDCQVTVTLDPINMGYFTVAAMSEFAKDAASTDDSGVILADMITKFFTEYEPPATDEPAVEDYETDITIDGVQALFFLSAVRNLSLTLGTPEAVVSENCADDLMEADGMEEISTIINSADEGTPIEIE